MIEKETEESNKHYEFYLVYQNMGYKRTLKKVAEEVQISVREIEKLSSKYGWVSRVDKFDKQQAQIRYNAMKAEIEEMGKRLVEAMKTRFRHPTKSARRAWRTLHE